MDSLAGCLSGRRNNFCLIKDRMVGKFYGFVIESLLMLQLHSCRITNAIFGKGIRRISESLIRSAVSPISSAFSELALNSEHLNVKA